MFCCKLINLILYSSTHWSVITASLDQFKTRESLSKVVLVLCFIARLRLYVVPRIAQKLTFFQLELCFLKWCVCVGHSVSCMINIKWSFTISFTKILSPYSIRLQKDATVVHCCKLLLSVLQRTKVVDHLRYKYYRYCIISLLL